ncbi:MAG TPA: nitrile hydratase subunit beta [Leptolyngbyaceae cyanobacterium M33_DOE_097]|uniref:nitrile hydratase n=1 Tax=Oscillatoriales cyanobacterium SpSt-418 TaxID=2282169 RepID=A0A7C3KDM8_9CYAN|nr:nitrile hydratase subunit beta [Leptolyngbyaceae cyanobacterium M33_DOE_097]
MKLQHFIGGLEGLEPSSFEKRVFVQPWEERIFGIHVAMMALSNHLEVNQTVPTNFKSFWTWGHLRTGAENMNPFDYFKYRYYEKWLGGISGFFVDSGYVSKDELDAKTAAYLEKLDAPLPEGGEPAIDEQVIEYLRVGDSPKCDVPVQPKFKVGDVVTVRNPPPADHCKLPGYLRTKQGVVEEVYEGAYNYYFPTGDGVGDPMPIYNVKFDSHSIWSNFTEPSTAIYVQIFEGYLEDPA